MAHGLWLSQMRPDEGEPLDPSSAAAIGPLNERS